MDIQRHRTMLVLPRYDGWIRDIEGTARNYRAVATHSTVPEHYPLAARHLDEVFMAIDPGLVHWPASRERPTTFLEPLTHPLRYVNNHFAGLAREGTVNGGNYRVIEDSDAAAQLWIRGIEASLETLEHCAGLWIDTQWLGDAWESFARELDEILPEHLSVVLNSLGPVPSLGLDVDNHFQLGRTIVWKAERLNLQTKYSPWREPSIFGPSDFWGAWFNGFISPRQDSDGGVEWCSRSHNAVVHITPIKGSDVHKTLRQWLPVWALLKSASPTAGPYLSVHDYSNSTDWNSEPDLAAFSDIVEAWRPRGEWFYQKDEPAGTYPLILRRGYDPRLPIWDWLAWLHEQYFQLLVYNPGPETRVFGPIEVAPRSYHVANLTMFNRHQYPL